MPINDLGGGNRSTSLVSVFFWGLVTLMIFLHNSTRVHLAVLLPVSLALCMWVLAVTTLLVPLAATPIHFRWHSQQAGASCYGPSG
jgi:hypothetical protein